MGIDYSYLEEVSVVAIIRNLLEVWVMPSTNETLSTWGEATSPHSAATAPTPPTPNYPQFPPCYGGSHAAAENSSFSPRIMG